MAAVPMPAKPFDGRPCGSIALHARLDDRTGIIYRHAVRLCAERIVY
jgi:hypothetical protein